MLEIITNNPFRTLGVYSNSKQAEIVRHVGKMKAYLNVGRTVEFPSDLDSLLPSINRTLVSAQSAQAAINLPNDKIRYALFWFCNAEPIDEVGLNNLTAGNVDKALAIFTRKESFSSLINEAVLSVVCAKYSAAYYAYSKLIHNYTYREQFCAAICGDTFQISEGNLAQLFIDEFLKEVKEIDLLKIVDNDSDKTYVRQKAVEAPIALISQEIAKAKRVTSTDAIASLRAGKALIRNTKSSLSTLRSIVGVNDIQYQSTADNLAKQILQCGINYYNNSNDDNNIDNGLEIQEYALSIAVGKMTKDRCQKNVDFLRQKKERRSYEKDLDAIAAELKSFQNSTPSISRVRTLVTNCKPHLGALLLNLGSRDDFYLQVSSAVANNALGMLIDVVNRAQNSAVLARNISDGSLETTIDSAVDAMSVIGTLDMTATERDHFNKNKNTLYSLQTQLSALTTRLSSSSSSYGGRTSYQSSSSSNSSDTNWGCIISIIIGVIIMIVAAING